jgi:hypothetical protein
MVEAMRDDDERSDASFHFLPNFCVPGRESQWRECESNEWTITVLPSQLNTPTTRFVAGTREITVLPLQPCSPCTAVSGEE